MGRRRALRVVRQQRRVLGCAVLFRPGRGYGSQFPVPRLTPWAKFCRPAGLLRLVAFRSQNQWIPADLGECRRGRTENLRTAEGRCGSPDSAAA